MNVPPRSSSGRSERPRAPSTSRRVSAAISARLLPVGVGDDRHEQRVVDRNGDADVDARVALDAPVDVRRVESRKLAQNECGGLDDEVVERGRVLGLLPRAAAKRDDLRHVGVGRDGEGRDLRSRLRHATRDRRLCRRQLDDGDVPAGSPRRPGRRSRRAHAERPRAGDPSAGAGAGDAVQREAELDRGPPRHRRRVRARARRRRAVRALAAGRSACFGRAPASLAIGCPTAADSPSETRIASSVPSSSAS